ncbi:fructose-bisphosphate aldolase [Candidatus Peregrinibacteria bacterium]|nr:fructose-bisphosphate aldolase [Candidatus Peregrinibacteria bacterium]
MTRIRSMLRESGTSLMLPYDQFIEHDIRHLEAESDAGNPDYIMDLAVSGNYNAVAVHYGVAKRYWSKLEGKVPLLLKINGKTGIPSQKQALSVYTSSVEDAVRLGACAIGYTMYYGSPNETHDLPQLALVRKACDQYGMPLVVWAYPRGEAVDVKGGRDTSYILESAARMAMEMGASIIKSNLPKVAKPDFFENEGIPSYVKNIEKELQAISDIRQQKIERAKRVVQASQGIPVLFSGGSEISESDLILNSEVCVLGGCFGFIFGRNMWKRLKPDALRVTKLLQDMLDQKAHPLFS